MVGTQLLGGINGFKAAGDFSRCRGECGLDRFSLAPAVFFSPQICRWRSCRDVLNCSRDLYIFCIFFTFFQKNFLVPFFVKVLKNTFKKLSSMSAEEILEAAASVEQLKRKP